MNFTFSEEEEAVKELAEQILGESTSFDRLREVEIAERLTLSRTPIREALRRLEAENIIEHRPRVGAVIRKLR